MSEEQWHRLVDRTAIALTGLPADKTILREFEKGDSAEERSSCFRDAVRMWVESENFVIAQKNSWLRDHGSVETDWIRSKETWNFEPLDQWIANSIREQLPYDQFVRSQIEGDRIDPIQTHRLATAIWFRPEKGIDIDFTPDIRGSSRLPPDQQGGSLRKADWLLWEEPRNDAQRLDDMERAMSSIQRSEQSDLDRLRNDNTVSAWHALQTRFPSIDASEVSFDLSSQLVPVANASESNELSRFAMESPLGRTREWSVVMELQPVPVPATTAFANCVLVRQRAADSDVNTRVRQWIVELSEGRLNVSMIHVAPVSRIHVESVNTLDRDRSHRIAIVYDGRQSAASIRIWIDGQWVPCTTRHDMLVKDCVSNHPQILEVRDRKSGAEDWIVEDLQCYRVELSEPELMGLDQDREWNLWESCSADEKSMWIEHYAKRIDPQWKYQRESFLFYAANYATLLESLPVMPVLSTHATPRPPALREHEDRARHFPESLLHSPPLEETEFAWSDRAMLASELRTRYASLLAQSEVVRQWCALLAAASTDDSHALDDVLLNEWKERFIASGWNRRALLQNMVLSKSWAAIAIDSQP